MVSVTIQPGKLRGTIAIPTSKSHTMRALLFALMAKGKSEIIHPLDSPDTRAMVDAIRQLGARVQVQGDAFLVEGGGLKAAEDVIQCGNSGQVLRFIGAIAGLLPSYTILTGDASIRHQRPVEPLLDGLRQLGAFAASNGGAPIIVKGPVKNGRAKIRGEDSQPVSGLLMMGAFSGLELEVENPGEKPWISLTLSWFDRLGIPYENWDFKKYRMRGGAKIEGFKYRVPGDFSSAAFSMAAGIVTGSEVTLDNIDLGDVQGDKALVKILQSMGAQFESVGSHLKVGKGQLAGMRIDVNDLIDALPILAVVACFASGQTEIVNGAIARKKESDRIRCMAMELRKMGADIEERPDGLIVRRAQLRGAKLESHGDHRLAMALTVAAMGAVGESQIDGVECAAKSYPTFFDDFRKIGGQIL